MDIRNDFDERIKAKGWPCACVKRDRKGRMTHIKLHAPEAKKCSRCGVTKEESDKAGQR